MTDLSRLLAVLSLAACAAGNAHADGGELAGGSGGPIRHLEYVVTDERVSVFDEDEAFALVKTIAIPGARGIRGVAASVPEAMLYISFGGDGAQFGTGAMLKLDLRTDAVRWVKHYDTGIDSMAISPDGKRIYMPTGELTRSGLWLVIDSGDGAVIGRIAAGAGPHNTVVSLDGTRVYLGSRFSRYLAVANTADGRIIRRIGPLVATVRPFTINGAGTLAFTTATHFLGFQVSDVAAGKVLFTVGGFGPRFPYDPRRFPATAPSHGISLSPDERELYVLDSPNSHIHVFDVSGLPASPPRQIADIPLTSMTGEEAECLYDCVRDGWVQHSRDGRFVFVGDAGDVIDTASRRVVATLEPLRNTRKHLEITWQAGLPLSTSTRTGVGYVRP